MRGGYEIKETLVNLVIYVRSTQSYSESEDGLGFYDYYYRGWRILNNSPK